ncbi:MAG: NYN domain-containing protein [Thermoanaerobaculum sp.]|nr:NYN domain-containing protein [Thermoanaerobaculum sp.]MCX7894530.1 NYN domain-containing protein [Thermoanaerobaculum sp.]MDW7968612.1 NYN domain-containing protein [Thermoanaerobaculum sp.]
MPWVVDGNNVARGGDREGVRRAALALARVEKLRLVLFFDGAPPAGVGQVEQLGAVEVRYVPHADLAIVHWLRRQPGGCLLITSDRALAAQARTLGARVLPAQAFWQKVERLPDSPSTKARAKIPAEVDDRTGVVPLASLPQRVVRKVRRKGRV